MSTGMPLDLRRRSFRHAQPFAEADSWASAQCRVGQLARFTAGQGQPLPAGLAFVTPGHWRDSTPPEDLSSGRWLSATREDLHSARRHPVAGSGATGQNPLAQRARLRRTRRRPRLDHFEGRSFSDRHRHVTLAALAQAFCTQLRHDPKPPRRPDSLRRSPRTPVAVAVWTSACNVLVERTQGPDQFRAGDEWQVTEDAQLARGGL